MSHKIRSPHLGEPDLSIKDLHLWIQGRQFPESNEYYDGNWLNVTVHCNLYSASIWLDGPILLVMDIEGFGKQCEAMSRGEVTSVRLYPLEPELGLLLEPADRLGHIRVEVTMHLEQFTQSHNVHFEIDQSYLPSIAKQCFDIVQKYPIRGR